MYSRNTVLLLLLCLLGFSLRMGAGLLLPNILFPDELIQSLEQAHRLVYGYGVVPWEFIYGFRSWLLPGFLASVIYATGWIAEGSAGYLAGVTAALSLLSLTIVVVAFWWGERSGGAIGAVLAAFACAVWFELVYFAPKAFHEVVATHLLILGVYFSLRRQGEESRKWLFGAGFLFGLTLALRIHLAPAVAVAALYTCRADLRRRWLPMVTGALIPVLGAGLLDWLTWSSPFESYIKYIDFWLHTNEFRDAARGLEIGGSSKGFSEPLRNVVHPWQIYFKILANLWSWGLIPLGALGVFGARRYPLPALVAATILITHTLIPHKEYRLIYPVIALFILLSGLGAAEVYALIRNRWESPKPEIAWAAASLVLFASLSLILATRFTPQRTLYAEKMDYGSTDHWHGYSGSLRAFERLSTEKTLCGVGMGGLDWWWSGGYAYLHRDVPIFKVSAETLNQTALGFNFLVYRNLGANRIGPYIKTQCWGSTCLYKRPGPCAEIEGPHIGGRYEATVSNIEERAAREAMQEGALVSYTSRDRSMRVEAEPVRYDEFTKCHIVRVKLWKRGSLIKDEETLVCQPEKRR